MSTPPPPTSTPSSTSLTRTLSYTLLLASPVLLALPPRKLDLYTFSLLAASGLSLRHLYATRPSRPPVPASADPPVPLYSPSTPRDGKKGGGEEGEGGIRAMARKVWMGDEGQGWKERRMREEREKLREGRGYGGLIADQIREVWGVRAEDDEGEDEG